MRIELPDPEAADLAKFRRAICAALLRAWMVDAGGAAPPGPRHRVGTGRSRWRANRRGATTSAIVAQRAMWLGRRSMAPFHTRRAGS